MSDLLQDVRFAIRQLRKNKTFTAIAVTTLALAVGATTAIFSVVHAVLLAPLPYRQVDRLTQVWGRNPSRGDLQFPISAGDFTDWKQKNDVFEDIAASYDDAVTLTGAGEPKLVLGYVVMPNYFHILGVGPQIGRSFTEEEAETKAPVVVLSHKFWRNSLHGDPNILGKAITLDGKPHTVIGVMAAGFDFPPRNELWMPLSLGTAASSYEYRYIRVIGRLKPGISVPQAQAHMNALEHQVADQHPKTDAGNETWVEPLQHQLSGDIRLPLLALFGAVGLVLLIACVNIASLFLARASDRKVEVSVRVALGATRLRLLRQFLSESLALSLIGGVVGILLAVWCARFLLNIFPNGVANLSIPKVEAIPINTSVLLFALAITIVTGLIFGLIPAMQSASADANDALRELRTSTSGVRSTRLRSALVAAQIALAMVLLAGGGLMIQSFRHVYAQNLGFHSDPVLALEVFLPQNRYPFDQPEKRVSFISNVIAGLKKLPGASSVSAVNFLPLSGFSGGTDFKIIGDVRQTDRVKPNADNQLITPEYFSTMGISVVRGRSFTETDRSGSEGVAIVNATFVRRYLANQDPVDKVLEISDYPHPVRSRIVGVVSDVKSSGAEHPTHAEIYRPLAQVPFPLLAFVVRTSGDPAALLKSAEQALWAVDKDQPVFDAMPMRVLAAQSITLRRTSTILLTAFAALALIVAAVGLYGVIAYSVVRRTHEIGIRMALGARRTDVLQHVLGQGMTLVLAGEIAGCIVALLVTQLVSGVLYGVSPRDPGTFFFVVLTLTAVALIACYVPARRATRVDPMVALRYE